VKTEARFFRHDSGRIVAALTRVFGIHNLALSEDVVQDAFCRALEVWKFNGLPENPSAWLMKAAKNRALDILRHERKVSNFAPELGRLLESEWTLVPTVNELFEPKAITDEQLQMMFSCCHSKLPEHSQVALILNILCGFSLAEIAHAFFSSEEATEKRVTRAKALLSRSRKLFELRKSKDFPTRLSAVQRALYLLFNEGYHGACSKSAIRIDLCQEAIRLAALLLENALTATSSTYALSALFCLDAARLPARLDDTGALVPLLHQDRSRWDQALIAEGHRLLEQSAVGTQLTEYHLEAAIASVHACAASVEETDWEQIVSLYNALMQLRPSPVVALNRAIAIGQHQGPELGLQAVQSIEELARLAAYPFYHAALAELELRRGKAEPAARHFREAIALARNEMERRFLAQRLRACDMA